MFVEQDVFGAIYRRNVEPYTVNVVEDKSRPFKGIRFFPSPGHTPGHTTIEVMSKGERLTIVGDAWFSQPDQVRNPEWTFLFETNSEDGVKSRTKILEKSVKRGDLILAYHEEFPGLGYIAKTQNSFDWIPKPAPSLQNGARLVCHT